MRSCPQSARIRTGTRQLLEKAEGAPDAAAVKTQVKQFGEQLQKLTGEEGYVATARQLENAIGSGAAGASEPRTRSTTLIADTEALQLLMENLAYLIAPPPRWYLRSLRRGTLARDQAAPGCVAGWRSRTTRTSRGRTREPTREQLADLAGKQREARKPMRGAPQPMSKSHPHLVAAHRHLSEAVAKLEAGDRAAAISSQRTRLARCPALLHSRVCAEVCDDTPPGSTAGPAPPIDSEKSSWSRQSCPCSSPEP